MITGKSLNEIVSVFQVSGAGKALSSGGLNLTHNFRNLIFCQVPSEADFALLQSLTAQCAELTEQLLASFLPPAPPHLPLPTPPSTGRVASSEQPLQQAASGTAEGGKAPVGGYSAGGVKPTISRRSAL